MKILNHSPRFKRYHFFSLTAMDYLGNPSPDPARQTLRTALERKIERVGAQYLLAHLGLAFDRYPVEFLTAVLDVKLRYPQIKIGLDKGLPYAIRHLKLLASPGLEVTGLLSRLFQNRFAFDMDRETAVLAGCLY